MSKRSTQSLFCFVAVSALTVASLAAQPSFYGVGDLLGGNFESHAYGISGNGSTVVGMSVSASGPEAFRWADGVITPLGDLADGGFESYAFGTSFDGTTIVGTGLDASGLRAVVWVNDLTTALEGLPGAVFSGAEDVSDDGTVIAGWSDSAAGEQAVLWQNGAVLALDDLSTTAFTSRAQAVSSDGQTVAGWRSPGLFSFEAFLWTGGTMTGLGFLPDGSDSQAYGISANGQHACGYSRNSSLEAAVWNNDTVTGLGLMPGGSFSLALDVSADGSVVVGSGDTGSGSEAFIWDARHGIRPLRQVLIDSYGLDLDGWVLNETHAVSDDGRTIAGTGRNPAGQPEGWVAYMPPASLQSSTPATGKTLWRSVRNTIRLYFDSAITPPMAGDLLIQEMLPGGDYGADLSSGFTFTVENDALGRPTALRIRENSTSLTHRKWYAVRKSSSWDGVTDFKVEYALQVGDATGDGRVLSGDASTINAGIPKLNASDDDRRDINGDGRILSGDVSITNAYIPSLMVSKPSGH